MSEFSRLLIRCELCYWFLLVWLFWLLFFFLLRLLFRFIFFRLIFRILFLRLHGCVLSLDLFAFLCLASLRLFRLFVCLSLCSCFFRLFLLLFLLGCLLCLFLYIFGCFFLSLFHFLLAFPFSFLPVLL